MPRDLSNWIERHEAAKMIGVSVSTIDRWIADERLESADRPRPGRKPAVIVNPAHVQLCLPPAPSTPAFLERTSEPAVAVRMDSFAGLAAKLAELSRAYAPVERFLTIAAASAETGLSESYLRKLVKEGKVPFIRDGRGNGYKVRKRDLCAL